MILDETKLKEIVRSRVNKHTRESFKYFWASFALQMLVYALLSHVIVKYWSDPFVVVPGIGGIALFIPFTVVLLKKFRNMAVTPAAGGSMTLYVSRYHDLLQSFYRFKRSYEMVLIPLATLVGTFVTFEIYVPGGIWEYPKAAALIFLGTIASCAVAIQQENRKSFEEPIGRLRRLLEDFKEE